MTHALVAAVLAMLLTIALGYPILAELRRRKFGKSADVPVAEQLGAYAGKAGTPTMGGLIFLLPITIIGLALCVTRDANLLLPLLAMLAAAALGVVDDSQSLVGAQKLSGHEVWFWFVKWGVLVGIGLAVALYLHFELDLNAAVLPHFGAYGLDLLYVPVVVVVFLVSTSGALITDGMDGLMAGVSAFAYTAYATIALTQGQDELGALALTIAAASAAFLWFNAHPAQVFMGEVGAQGLAVGLVVIAFMTGWWLLLPVIGIIFVIEGLSDVIQIGYFKLTRGKRFFRMAPVHYHFQLSGWAETQVVARFWLIGLLGGLAGIALALVD